MGLPGGDDVQHAGQRLHRAPRPRQRQTPSGTWRNISTPELSVESGYVTPNVNVVYGFGFLDLGPEPIVLNVPDSNGRYYLVEIVDMYTNAFAYVGGLQTGYKGGKFALVGPGWTGKLPAGAHSHRLPDAMDADPAACARDQSKRPGRREKGPACD